MKSGRSVREGFLALPPAERRAVHDLLVEDALARWKAYATFPDPLEFAYYAVYNFFRKYALNEEVDDWLIVNQAVSSEEDETKWERALPRAIEEARRRRP